MLHFKHFIILPFIYKKSIIIMDISIFLLVLAQFFLYNLNI